MNRTAVPSLPSLLLAVPFLASVVGAQGGPPPAPVRVDAVRLENVQERRAVTGEVRPVRRALVASEEAGRVAQAPAREGQSVAAGDILCSLDAGRLRLDLGILDAQQEALAATLSMRAAELTKADLDLETVRELSTRDAANKKEVSDRETAVQVARSLHAQAEGELATIAARRALLERRVDDMQVRAPFAGIVVARHTEVGEWLGVGATVVELLSQAELEAWIEVPQRFVGAVTRERGTLELLVDATGARFEVPDFRTIPVVDPRARTFSLVAPLADVTGLAPGMSISALVPTGAAGEHATISADALLRNDAGPFVWVVRGAGGDAPAQAYPVLVELLFHSAGRVVVRGALSAGELLVIEGGERLFPMAPVQPIVAEGDAR